MGKSLSICWGCGFLPGTARIVLPAGELWVASTEALGEGWWCVNWKGPSCISRCCPQQEKVPMPWSSLMPPPSYTVRVRDHASGPEELGRSGYLNWAGQHPRMGPAHDLLSGVPTCCLLRRPLPGPAPGSGYLGSQPAHGGGPMCHLPAHW